MKSSATLKSVQLMTRLVMPEWMHRLAAADRVTDKVVSAIFLKIFSATSLAAAAVVVDAVAAAVVVIVRTVAATCNTTLSFDAGRSGIRNYHRHPCTVLTKLAETCNGSGAKPGTHPQTCPTCHGNGQVRMQQGFFAIQQTYPHCHGSGKIIADPCPDCHGQGRKEKQKTLSVRIPAGVDNGDRVRLAGEGEEAA